jgi:hypothetical protein
MDHDSRKFPRGAKFFANRRIRTVAQVASDFGELPPDRAVDPSAAAIITPVAWGQYGCHGTLPGRRFVETKAME